MKVRSVGVRRVWDCMLCACVSEEGGDGEGVGSETPSLLSYTLRYVSLAELGTVCRVGLREPMHLCAIVVYYKWRKRELYAKLMNESVR